MTPIEPLLALSPCPFCGAAPNISAWESGVKAGHPDAVAIECSSNLHDCPVCPTMSGFVRHMAVTAWNTRANSESLANARGAGWLPIESAPKDGTRVLLHCPRNGSIRGKWEADQCGKPPRPYWTNDCEFVFGKLKTRDDQPTHWRPLPPAPGSEAGS